MKEYHRFEERVREAGFENVVVISTITSMSSVGRNSDVASSVIHSSTGNKQERVRDYILNEAPARFRRRDVERALPGTSLATIRLVLTQLRDAGQIKAEGSGAGAHWARV